MVMFRSVAVTSGSALALLCAGGCTSTQALTARSLAAATSSPAPSVSSHQLNALTFSIDTRDSQVVSGGEATYELTIRNDSGGPITVASCETSLGGRALVPVGDRDADLWMKVIVDCGGPQVIEDGETQRTTDTVYAHDKYGAPLEPGEYLIGRQIRGVPNALFVPLTVVAASNH